MSSTQHLYSLFLLLYDHSQAAEMSTTTITPEPPVADDTQPTTPVEKAPPSSEEPVKVDSQQLDTEKEKKERGKTPEAAPAAGESGKTEKTKMSEAEAALDKELDGVSNNATIIYLCFSFSYFCRKMFGFRLYNVVVNSRSMVRRSQQP